MSTPALNLDFVQARPIVPRAWKQLEILLVGCGGTGSWLAPHLARLTAVLREEGKAVGLTFIDPDRVEAVNIPRQQFCAAELDQPKAAALALRYNRAWGLDIRVRAERFRREHIDWNEGETLRIVVGCVDNAAARQTLATLIHDRNDYSWRADRPPAAWWLDCGNARDSGQVLLGTTGDPATLWNAFTPDTICRALPSPALQAPTLLEALPDEVAPERLSCAELAVANAQSLLVNTAVAAVAADYLLRLAVTGDLRRFATYLDGPSGVAKSSYTTPAAVGAVIGQEADWFSGPPATSKRRSRARVAA